MLEEGVGEARARSWATLRFLKHLGELISLLAGVICPSLPAVPVSLLGLNLLLAPLEAED